MSEPRHLTIARSLIGVREVPGAGNSATIMGWIRRLGIGALGVVVNADSVPWCGTFVAYCVKEAGLKPAPIAVRAKAWAAWEANIAADRLAPGAILVFDRQGGGHVGFYVGEDDLSYHVLGGNQSDAVNIMRLAKSRCIARRWPRGVAVLGKPVRMSARAGVPLSRNEA